jgi:hypothetical protein
MAGNRAVAGLVARNGAARTTVPTLQRQPGAPTIQRDQPIAPETTDTSTPAPGQEPPVEEDPEAMVVRANSMAQAAKDLAGFTKTLTDRKTGQPLSVVIIALEPKLMEVYDGDGNHLKGPFEVALPKGTWFDEGVFVTFPGAPSMRMRMDPKMKRFRPYEDAAILQEKPPAPPKGAPNGAAPVTKPDPQAPAGSAVDPAPNAPKGFDLRKYIKNPAGLDELKSTHGQAVEFIVVRTPLSDTGTGKQGKPGGARTSGFAGEVEGRGTPPNRPPWPVTMEGPKTLPIGGQGTFAATTNWAANGSNKIDMVTAQMGNDIHYRWELFDITAQAKKEADKQAERARQAKATIEAMMRTASEPGAKQALAGAAGAAGAGGTGAGGANADKPGPKPGATGAAVVTPPAPKPVGSPDEKSLADEILERQGSRVGSGADMNGITAGDDFNRDFKNLWGDTKRTWAAVGESKAETWAERRSDDLANLSAVGLLPVSSLITLLGASFRYGSEKFAGERQQQDIPMPSPGTYLVRVIATPRVMTSSSGEQIVRPASVATQVVQVKDMETMVAASMLDPGTREKEAQNAFDAAKKALDAGTGDQKALDAAKAQLDSVKLEVSGDPLLLLDKKIAEKQKELDAAKAKWERYNIRGPIIDVENQLDTLKKRRDLYKLQEEKRVAGMANDGKPIVPPTRVNATLASELTGQPYPLLISIGPMGMAGTKHRWKVLDATSKKAEGFEGVGDTADEAVENAFRSFAADAQYGRGIIGVQLPKALLDQLEPGAKADRRYTSAPAGWAVARGRIDDLVMTLAAIGLFVATAGTAAAILGGIVAAGKLIHRLRAGTLEFDVETISDVLAIFGAAGAVAQGAAKGAQATAAAAKAEAQSAKAALKVGGVTVQPVGELFVLVPEAAAAESKLAQASAALARAGTIAKRVEWANEALGYAGLVWGNGTFLLTMADIAAQEAGNQISASEARRLRANAIGGAIQNNGMFLAGNIAKARAGKQAAKAASAASDAATAPSSSGPTTAEPATAKPAAGAPEPVVPKEAVIPKDPAGGPEGTGPKEPLPTEKPAPQDKPTKGGPADEPGSTRTAPEPNVPEGQPGAKESAPVETKPVEAPKPAAETPAPGSAKARKAAKAILDGVATRDEPHAGVEDAIKLAGGWKEALKAAVGKLKGEERAAAEKALVEVRDNIVNDTWKDVQKAAGGKYDNLRLENAGTKSFGSDVDATVRPLEGTEATATGKQMSDQIRLAGEAAQAMSKALRERLGGAETDAVIDTNIYSFIGEGRIKAGAGDAKGKAAQQQVDLVVGLAEQLRGQNEAQFKAFEQRLLGKLGDARVVAEAKTLLAQAREFHKARMAELGTAMAKAKADPANKTEAAQRRAAREELLATKKRELSELSAQQSPDLEKITAKQAEINWFAPDAYATPSAFKQAVAHGQRLKGAGRSASEYTGPEVAAKLREAAGRLAPDDPHGSRLRDEAKLVEDQQRLLDSTLSEQKALQNEAPMNAERVDDLGRRADRIREAIAARAEKVIVAEIFGETAPPASGEKPSTSRLTESAAASGANMGMLEDHVRHAPDVDGQVKAAAKYGARIAMAEMLSGLRPAGDAIAQLLGKFVKSRWDLAGDFAPDMLRDMFLEYALKTGRGKEIVHDKQGLAVGVTDECKQAFVDDVRSWARSTNDGVQAAAIGSKAFDSPAPPAPAAPTGGGTPPKPDTAAGPPPQERPTVVPSAPESSGPQSSGPATRRDATGQGANEQTAPAKPAPAEPGSKLESFPGGIKVTADDYAVTARAKDDPTALVRLEPAGNTIRLTDIYRRNLPAGSGVILLTAALQKIKAVRGNELLIHNIINPETLEAHKAGQDPALSKLGKTVQRALEAAGLQAGPMRWETVHDKLCIVVEIR